MPYSVELFGICLVVGNYPIVLVVAVVGVAWGDQMPIFGKCRGGMWWNLLLFSLSLC